MAVIPFSLIVAEQEWAEGVQVDPRQRERLLFYFLEEQFNLNEKLLEIEVSKVRVGEVTGPEGVEHLYFLLIHSDGVSVSDNVLLEQLESV